MIILKPQRGGETTGGGKINSSAPPAVLGLRDAGPKILFFGKGQVLLQNTLGIVFPHLMHCVFGKDSAFDAFLSLSINIKTSLRIAFGKGF